MITIDPFLQIYHILIFETKNGVKRKLIQFASPRSGGRGGGKSPFLPSPQDLPPPGSATARIILVQHEEGCVGGGECRVGKWLPPGS